MISPLELQLIYSLGLGVAIIVPTAKWGLARHAWPTYPGGAWGYLKDCYVERLNWAPFALIGLLAWIPEPDQTARNLQALALIVAMGPAVIGLIWAAKFMKAASQRLKESRSSAFQVRKA